MRLLVLALVACSTPGPSFSQQTVSSEWKDLSIPGARFFIERITPAPADYDNRTAILELGGRRFRGKEAIGVLVREKAIADPMTLAQLSELFLDSVGGRIITTPAEAQSDRAASRVKPPAVSASTLEYWAWSGGMAHNVQRVRVDLKTFQRDAQTADGLELDENPLPVVRRLLGGPGDMNQRGAVDLLVTYCAREGAAALMDGTLRTHPSVKTRAHAAWSIRKCHDQGTIVAVLIEALEQDEAREVRAAVAETLGELGAMASPALPVLDRLAALESGDNLDVIAKRAAGKIRKTR